MGVTCNAATHCLSGSCVDDCSGAACPGGGACSAGQCQPPPIAAAPDAGGGSFGNPEGGLTAPDDAGGGTTGKDASAGDGPPPLGAPSHAGCGCRSVGDETGAVPIVVLLGAGVAVGIARRRVRRGVAGR
jgi:MYXO-CTERM domain-containing protein